MSSPYSTRYYEALKEDSSASARFAVPKILDVIPAKSVVDVGCGSGTWARAYLDAGCDVLGIDGAEVQTDQLLIPNNRFQRRNLVEPLKLDRRFDLVNCLEVAEHLPGTRATSFVSDLCAAGDVVVFSAAVPGQGGTYHVNEQWPTYWISRFADRGYVALDCIRPVLWNQPDVAWWYAQNLFVFIRRERLSDYAKAKAAAQTWPTDLVHPRAYVRATVPEQMSPRMLKEVLRALPYFPGKIARHFGR
jgi:SAM-dependent methyltransferase